MQALENFNWLDILIILYLLSAIYTGARSGLTAELFKILGNIISIVLGFHYYGEIANALLTYINMPVWLAQFIILLVFVISIRITVKYLVILLLKILNIQFVVKLERIGGAIAGLVRGFLIAGFILVAFSLFPVEYLQHSIYEKSTLAPFLIKSAQKTYTSIIGLIPSQKAKQIATPLPVPAEQAKKQTKPR